MSQITYTVLPHLAATDAIKVVNQHGGVTVFGDFYAYSLFLTGAGRARQNGVTITVIGMDGNVIVGTVEQMDSERPTSQPMSWDDAQRFYRDAKIEAATQGD